MSIIFEELYTQEVPNVQRDIAWQAKRHVEKDLGVNINIVFCRETDRRNPDRRSIDASSSTVVGKAEHNGTVWIKEGLSKNEIIRTVSHEAYHVKEYRTDSNTASCRNAEIYEDEIFNKFNPNSPVKPRKRSVKKQVNTTRPGIPLTGEELIEVRSRLGGYNEKLRKRLGLGPSSSLEVRCFNSEMRVI